VFFLGGGPARGGAPRLSPTQYHRLPFRNLVEVSEWGVEEALRDVQAVRMGTSLFALGYLIHPIDFGA
jgi:hypothetical protein